MKKIIVLFLLAGLSLSIFAQDIDQMMADLAKQENVQHEVVDQDMLKMALSSQQENMPPFMEKLTAVEVVAQDGATEELRNDMISRIANFKDGNGYETLLTVKEGVDNVRIITHKDKEGLTHIYIMVVDEDDIAFVKMSGTFDEKDLEDIINEQKKNK